MKAMAPAATLSMGGPLDGGEVFGFRHCFEGYHVCVKINPTQAIKKKISDEVGQMGDWIRACVHLAGLPELCEGGGE